MKTNAPNSPSICHSLKSSILHSLSNRSLNPSFIFRYTPPKSPISTFVDLPEVVKATFSFRQAIGGTRASSNMSSNGGDAEKREAEFSLSPTSLLKIQKGDITRWFIDGSSDAIVCQSRLICSNMKPMILFAKLV